MARTHTIYLALRDAEALATRDAISREITRTYTALGDTRAASDTAAPLLAAWSAITGTVRAVCPQCGAAHDALWTVRRIVSDTLGPWNVFRVNGAPWTLPGGGLPLTVDTLPRDAVPVDPDGMARFWHDAWREFSHDA